MARIVIDEEKINQAIEKHVRREAKKLANQLIKDAVRQFEIDLQTEVDNNIETILDDALKVN